MKIIIEEQDINYKPKSITVNKMANVDSWVLGFPLCDVCRAPIEFTVRVIQSSNRARYNLHPGCMKECE